MNRFPLTYARELMVEHRIRGLNASVGYVAQVRSYTMMCKCFLDSWRWQMLASFGQTRFQS